jgi:acylphosphatase
MASERHAAKVRISGHVQGVYFRAWTRGEAERLSLDGWVRNENDGSVTALIAGPRGDVDAMIALLHRGPPDAVVSQVVVEDVDPAEVAGGFGIRS